MTIPQTAIDLIKEFEGLRLHAYPDPVKGWDLPTIGYGTTRYPDGGQVHKGDDISPSFAEESLIHHLEVVVLPHLVEIPTWGQMTENKQASVMDFGYNLGKNFYGGEKFKTITHFLNFPEQWKDQDRVHYVFEIYSNPKDPAVHAGLLRRREAEADLFLL